MFGKKESPELKDARRRLAEYSEWQKATGNREETNEYLRLNRAVIKAQGKKR